MSENEIRRQADGSIDYDHYRSRARTMRAVQFGVVWAGLGRFWHQVLAAAKGRRGSGKRV